MKIDSIGVNNLSIQNSLNAKQVSEDQAFEEVLKKAYDDGDKEKLMDACKDFEAIFLGMVFKQMKKTIPEGGLFEKSYAREIFEEMLDDELIDNAKGSGLGIAEAMYKQLSANLDNIYKVSNK